MMHSLSLKGLRVLNTRAQQQAKTLASLIEKHQGISVPLPILLISPLDASVWIEQLTAIPDIHKAIFTSVNAVECFFNGIRQKDRERLRLIQVYAVGSATQQALKKQQIFAQCPTIHNSEAVVSLPSLLQIQNEIIVIIKGLEGRCVISTSLRQRNAEIHEVAVYQRHTNWAIEKQCESIWRNDAVDIILGSSQFVIDALFSVFNEEGRQWLRGKPWIVYSQRLMKAAQKIGVRCVYISEHQQLIKCLAHFNQGLLHDQKQ